MRPRGGEDLAGEQDHGRHDQAADDRRLERVAEVAGADLEDLHHEERDRQHRDREPDGPSPRHARDPPAQAHVESRG